jgi:hypothetical protein
MGVAALGVGEDAAWASLRVTVLAAGTDDVS